MAALTLSPGELRELTKYSRARDQLRVLHSRGFLRAYIGRTGSVILERAHFDAVSRGQAAPERPKLRPVVHQLA